MLNEAQIRVIKEIAQNQYTYISMAKESKNDMKLDELYKKFSPIYSKYMRNLMNEVLARTGYDKALKSHKIDPYIAGGAAQGIAGIGAGFYAANNAAVNNQKIDESRNYWKNSVYSASVETSSTEIQILAITDEIDKILNSIQQIKEYREKQIEELYVKAKKLTSKISKYEDIKEAEKIFDSLGNYKDSALLKVECTSKKTTSRQLKIAKYSAIIAVVVFVFCISEPFIAIPVALFTFIYSDILLQFQIKK